MGSNESIGYPQTEEQIDKAIESNLERGFIIGLQGSDLIVQNLKGRGAVRINKEEWNDLKVVIEALLPGTT